MANYTPLKKRNIKPVRVTVTLEATQINEHGTFSSFNVVSVNGPNSSTKVSKHPKGGGAMFVKSPTLDNIELLPENAPKSEPVKVKLF